MYEAEPSELGNVEDTNGLTDQTIVPNPEYLESLMKLNVPEDTAIKALVVTQNESLEKATIMARDMELSDEDNWEDIVEYKMIFAVNTSLNLGVGKVAVQVADAALKLMSVLQADETDVMRKKLEDWRDEGSAKEVCACECNEYILRMKKKAKKFKVPYIAVNDAENQGDDTKPISVFAIFGSDAITGLITSKLSPL